MNDRRTFLSTAVLSAGAFLTHTNAEDEKLPGKTPNTKFAVNCEMWFTKLKFLERIEASAKLGFNAIEFWPWQGKDLKAVADTCAKHKIDIAQFTAWGFSPGLNDAKNHNQFVEAVDKGCEVAKSLNCKMMCVVGGDDIPGVSQEKMHDTIVEGLKKAAPIAEKHRIMLILEPMNIRVDHKGHCLYGSAPTIRIIKAVGSDMVKINWDLYHMHITEGDLCGHLREGIGQVGYIQVADHPGRNEPGTGEINYTRVYKELQKLGYKGIVGLECRPLKDETSAAWAVNKSDQW